MTRGVEPRDKSDTELSIALGKGRKLAIPAKVCLSIVSYLFSFLKQRG